MSELIRAFKRLKLPLGAYQFVTALGADLGDQFTNGGKDPRTLVLEIQGIAPGFKETFSTLMLTEEAQRHLVAVLEANLADSTQRATELIRVFHSDYGEIDI